MPDSHDATLVEVVLHVQTLVSNRAPPNAVYDAVVDGALRLMHGVGGSLRLVDLEDPSWMVAVATRGFAGAGERWGRRPPIRRGVSGRVISTGQTVVIENYASADVGSQLAPPHLKSLIGVPLHEQGRMIGSLVVGWPVAGRLITETEKALLKSYSEHVCAALSVATASNAMIQAYTDSLTGLGNRALLLDRLEHELVRADRGGESVTVLFLDLDRFKLVNDSLGHLIGDQLLMAVAEGLRRCIREGDVCTRLGGDEFAVLLADPSDPAAVAERIIKSLRSRFQIGEHEVFVSASVGIASGREEADILLRNADVAMYHAKRAGADRYARFKPSMHAARLSRPGLDTELRLAVERGEFELHYQPIFELNTGRIAALEALLRWHHPARGLVAPLEFIPVAEETGLILEIGRWVLTQACSQFAAWWREIPLAISINVSVAELQTAGYTAAAEQAIAGAFPPSALIFELTETARLQDARGAMATLHSIKDLGSRVALDDFGTGYSSLLNLSHIPVDLLKIPRPFIEAAGRGGHDTSSLLAGILGLGRHLGLMTVGEGIERPQEHALLVDLGCDLGQGFLLGRPLDAVHTTELLMTEHAKFQPRRA